jgi:hypothetical protein
MIGDERITLRLALAGGRIDTVAVRSSRGSAALRLLENQPLPRAVALLPMLFSLCGQAQGAVAHLAAAAAEGYAPACAELTSGKRRVQAEALQEHLWRVLVDWPQWLDETPDMAAVGELRHGVAKALRGDAREWQGFCVGLEGLLSGQVWAMPTRRWLEMTTLGELRHWAEEGETVAARMIGWLLGGEGAYGASGVPCLPLDVHDRLSEVAAAMGADPDYPRYPTWQGEPGETGALARMGRHPLLAQLLREQGNTVAARFVARLLEVAQTAIGLENGEGNWLGAMQLAPGVAVAWAETARGLLVHRLEAREGRVRDYRIVAPTEWNFHPRGALAAGLAGQSVIDGEDARRKAQLLVQALDPCVACSVEVGHNA